MRTVVVVELAVLASMWAVFAGVYLREQGWRTRVGRQLTTMALVGILEALSLIALGLGHPLPLWAYAAVFGVTDVVAAGWLVLLWRARHDPPET